MRQQDPDPGALIGVVEQLDARRLHTLRRPVGLFDMADQGVQNAGERSPTDPHPRYGRLDQVTVGSISHSPEEHRLVERLRARDETTFVELVERWTPSMLRVARGYVATQAAAEDVVQETWLGVLNGIDRFEERSSLKTWVFQILSNRAKTRGQRDKRSLPFSSLASDATSQGPTVDPARFRPSDHTWARHWNVADGHGPADWGESPEDRVVSRDGLRLLVAAIDALPEAQRIVITLRDVEGFPSEEVCALLDISAGNQRVLLHRARARVRADLERELAV